MFKNRKIKKARKQLKKSIASWLANNIERNRIIEEAIKVGWTEETVQKIFNEIENEDILEIKIPIKKRKEPLEEAKKEKPKGGLVSQINELNEKIDIISKRKKTVKKFKKKRFKIPFRVKSQLKKLAIKNKVQVMLLQRTRNIKPVIGEIRDGMLLVGENIYNGSVNSTWLWRGKYPTHIVPEWDLQPITPEGISQMRGRPLDAGELYADTIKNDRSSEPQKIIIRAMEAKQNQMLKGKASVKAIIIAIVVTIIVVAVLFGSGSI